MEPPRPHKTSFSVGTSTLPPGGMSAVILLSSTAEDADGLSERVLAGDNVKSMLLLPLPLLLCLPKYALGSSTNHSRTGTGRLDYS
jgi:hypothetical protein